MGGSGGGQAMLGSGSVSPVKAKFTRPTVAAPMMASENPGLGVGLGLGLGLGVGVG